MNETVFEQIASSAADLKIDLSAAEIASLAQKENMCKQSINDISTVFSYLEKKHNDAVVDQCIKMSRLPRKEPKTFENFDFNRIHGKDVEVLKNISTLAPLYAKKNMAFIGPQDIEVLTKQQKIEEYIMLGFRLSTGISITKLKELGFDVLKSKKDIIELYKKNNIICVGGDNIVISKDSFGACNQIILDFLP